jgi:hypothetical protein
MEKLSVSDLYLNEYEKIDFIKSIEKIFNAMFDENIKINDFSTFYDIKDKCIYIYITVNNTKIGLKINPEYAKLNKTFKKFIIENDIFANREQMILLQNCVNGIRKTFI